MQLLSTMALTMVTSLNKVALQRLVAAYGSAQAVFDAAGDPDAEPQMDPALAKQLATSQATLFQRAEQELNTSVVRVSGPIAGATRTIRSVSRSAPTRR